MAPRHFWWLVETLKTKRPGAGITKDERAKLLAMLEHANRGAT